MVERTVSALRFAPNATLKITPFEAHHVREANSSPEPQEKAIITKSQLGNGIERKICMFNSR